jgi:signal-transduction protein with cAMP-binding, CBS, and nucleotidyltransferase domain
MSFLAEVGAQALTIPTARRACYIEALVANTLLEAVRMHVRDGMSKLVLTIGPGHTLRDAARLMAERRVGAAVVMDPDGMGPGIITERDLMNSVGAGQEPDDEHVADHLTSDIVYAAPDWSLEEAAVAMVRGNFRHLIVCEGPDVVGVLSVRDVVRVWTDDGSICEVPESASFGAAA